MLELLGTVLCYLLLTVVSLFFVTLVTLMCFKNVRQLVFSVIYPIVSKAITEDIVEEKTELFSVFKGHKSKKGFTWILEVGAGPGNNFQYYPQDTKLTVIEPNNYSVKKMKQKLKRNYPKTKLERVLIGQGEDMSAIENGSMDYVVATFVLCSVHDINRVLQEIHRVLTPGGKYIFLEHGYGRRKWWIWALQHIVNPFWIVFGDGCQVIKNTIEDINGCGLFVNVHHKWYPPPAKAFILNKLILGNCFHGSAQKKNK